MKLVNGPLVLISRVILGAILVYACIEKIVYPAEFARAIANYHIMPYGLENAVAILLPWLELVIGLALLTGFFLDGAAGLTAALMVVFIAAIGSAILRGYNIECGCGLREGDMVGLKKIIEDVAYLVLSFIILNRQTRFMEFSPNSDSKNI